MIYLLTFVPLFKKGSYKLNWDALGVFASLLCAIHCALLPVVLTSLPILGVNIIHNAYFEWGMIVLAFLIGCYSLCHGFTRHHRNLIPVMLFFAGFLFLVLKQFLHAHELWLLFIAVPLIISAHYYNYRLCHRSKCTSPHHSH